MSQRIVVFTGSLSFAVRKNIVEIDRAIGDLQWLIVRSSPSKTVRQLLKSQWHNLKRNGWRWIPYQFADIVHRVIDRSGTPPADGVCGSEFTQGALKGRTNLRILDVGDLHSESTLAEVKKFAPDVGLSLSAPILRKSLFAIPRLGTLNLHKGEVPAYRGMPPAFWELWNNAPSVGCTVHWVDEKLDTGDIAARTQVPRERFSTLRGLQLTLDEVGIDLVREAVQGVLDGTVQRIPQEAGGKTYRKPTLAQVAALDRKLRSGADGVVAGMKEMLKTAGSKIAFASWRAGLWRAAKPRITVLLYHRVSDAARDNLTVGVEQFDRQMALLRKHCQPMSLQELLTRTEIPKASKPLVCVTFDDGYLDNCENAAPILLRHQIPAAFFVSTGIVGTDDGRFPHDIRRGNPPIPIMQWEHVRKMHGSGFEIGSHSVSHLDCAAEAEEKVWLELCRSREDLRRELGLQDVAFGYPYGGRQHMTPQRLALVKKAGYSACLSAYGGSNITKVDRFNVLRRGIHWKFSDRALLLECLGLT